MNKQMFVLTLASILVIAILVRPVLKNDAEERLAGSEPTPSPNAETVPLPASPLVTERQPVAELQVKTVREDNIVKLSFPEGRHVSELAVARAGESFVHMIAYSAESRDKPGVETVRYDALLVQPGTLETKLFPLYETSSGLWHEGGLFQAVDNRQIMFIRQTEEGDARIYDLAELDIATGEIRLAAPVFWKRYQQPGESPDDFLLGDWHEESGKLLISTFKGRMWTYDRSGGQMWSRQTQTYPAYGDPGSKPPRSLAYPSPDLGRMVYQIVGGDQIYPSNHFQVIDWESRSVVAQFSVKESEFVGDDSVVWNEAGTAFLLEYADRDEPLGSSYDNGSTVFAQAIAVYDRDGAPIRTVSVPQGSEERINAFAWLGDSELLVEHYIPELHKTEGWKKGSIVYKLHHIRTGQATTLRKVGDASALKEPAIVGLHAGLTYGSSAFVLLDRKNGQLWDPAVIGHRYESDGQLYVRPYGGDPSSLFRWNGELGALEWVADEQDRTIRTVGGGWILARNNGGSGFQYIPVYTGAVHSGLPVP